MDGWRSTTIKNRVLSLLTGQGRRFQHSWLFYTAPSKILDFSRFLHHDRRPTVCAQMHPQPSFSLRDALHDRLALLLTTNLVLPSGASASLGGSARATRRTPASVAVNLRPIKKRRRYRTCHSPSGLVHIFLTMHQSKKFHMFRMG